MKIRSGFVSNSSSSSFVCDICGATESGWDASPEDCGFFGCVNGHIICQEEAYDGEDRMDDYECELKEEYCPVCAFEILSRSDAKKYLQKKYSISDDEVFAIIKEKNKRKKKLYDFEYVNYVYEKFNIQENALIKKLKNKFKNYSGFKTYLRS